MFSESTAGINSNKYLVETILLDDIVDLLPKQSTTNQTYTKAILKIDIEGVEPLAFEYCQRFFSSLDIRIIFMEWGSFSKKVDLHDSIHNMIVFLTNLDYYPYDGNVGLNSRYWYDWPWDVIWRKID